MTKRGLLAAIVWGALWLGGCAGPQTRTVNQPIGQDAMPSPREPALAQPSPPSQVGGESLPAVVALADSAREARMRGDLDRAVADVERALRLDSANPSLWHQLAELRLDQGRAAQAESLALKSNQFAVDDRRLRQANWELIARARRLRGDEAGAQAALRRARELGRE
jgi:tetratricopeptide (TPR) repeat protein